MAQQPLRDVWGERRELVEYLLKVRRLCVRISSDRASSRTCAPGTCGLPATCCGVRWLQTLRSLRTMRHF